jgi:GntR family transcriptional regulator
MGGDSTGINRDSDVPLYMQLVKELERRVQSGKLINNDMFPSESALMEQYGLSRITVRQALANLEQRGLIYRRRGKGTFLRGPQVSQKLTRKAKTIVEALRDRGIEPEVRIVGLNKITAPEHVANILGTGNEPVMRLRRLYLYEDSPIALVDLFLPLALSGVAEVLSQEEHKYETSYSVFENEMHIGIKEAKHVIRTSALQSEVAEALDMPEAATCLTMDRITYSESENVLEMMTFYYAADSFEFEITLPRNDDNLSYVVTNASRADQ